MTIQETAEKAVHAMLEQGYNELTAWGEYSRVYRKIVNEHERNGISEFDETIVTTFIENEGKRFDNGEITLHTFRNVKSMAKRFIQFHRTRIISKRKKSINNLTEYYLYVHKCITNELNGFGYAARSLKIFDSHAKSHFMWLAENGYDCLDKINGETLRDFFVFNSEKYSARTMISVKSSIKKIYAIMKDIGLVDSDFDTLFAFRIFTEKKVMLATPPEETAAVLAQIDRKTQKGKRDYVIMLLGVTLGLRACDIASLKLGDIDWWHGEIHVYQPKTHKHAILPLTKNVGEALKDYILNGRIIPGRKHDESIETLFLSHNAPIRGITANGVKYAYRSYRVKAGLISAKFHGLRRALGRGMVISGVPLTDVAQVLVHDNLDSTKQYISLDSKHLKECAIGFAGITPKGGDTK